MLVRVCSEFFFWHLRRHICSEVILGMPQLCGVNVAWLNVLFFEVDDA